MTTRGPGQRAGLTREAVLAAARSILADGGLDGLTMRALADDLGVAPNAIYSHVASKSGLVDDLLDDVLAEVAPPSASDPWTGLRDVMTSTYEVLLDHTPLVPIYLARQGARGPNAQRLGTIMDGLLVRAGLTGSSVDDARRTLIVFTIGFAAFTVQVPPDRDGGGLTREDSIATFTRGLDWLLAGIVRPA